MTFSCLDDVMLVRKMLSRKMLSREKRVIFNNFRCSVRFLDSHEMLVNTIDILSN